MCVYGGDVKGAVGTIQELLFEGNLFKITIAHLFVEVMFCETICFVFSYRPPLYEPFCI